MRLDMKCFLLLLALSGLLTAPVLAMQTIWDVFPDTKYATLAKARLHGPVKTVHSFIEKGGVLFEELTFDTKGNLVKEMYHHANTGELLWTHLYTYNEAGLLVEATSSGQYVKHTGARCLYEYDGKGNLLTRTSYGTAGKPLRKCSFTYDASGHKLTEENATWDIKQQWHMDRQEWRRYNEHGNEVEWRIVGPNEGDVTTVTTSYQYAPDGAMLRREENWSDGQQKRLQVYTAQGKLLEYLYIPLVVPGKYRTGEYMHERYTYTAGNVTQDTKYNEKGTLTCRTEYVYNTTGQQIEERFYFPHPGQREPTFSGKQQFRYDTKGHKIEEKMLNCTDKPNIFTTTTVNHWSYDAYGNMTAMPKINMYIGATYWEYSYFKQ